MRTFNTLPTNNDFFEQYATLIPTLYRLGFLAQIVSALTEVSIIYAIVYSSVRDFLPDLAHIIGAVGALIGTAFIEVGLRKFLPHSVRSILYRRFKGLELAMTIFILSSTVGLLATSAALSFKNSKTIVEAVAPPPNIREATAEGSEYRERKEEALQLFRADSTATAARFTAEAEARRNEFHSLIQVERTKLAALREKEKSSGERYPTQRQRVNARISEIEATMNAELATIEQRKAAALASIQAERQNALKAAQNDFSEARERIQTENDENRKTAAEKIEKYGGGLAWFTVVALFVFCLSVCLNEIHRKGSGIKEAVQPTQYDFSPGVLEELNSALSERLNYSALSKIRRFADSTPAAPLPLAPAPLYDLAQMEQLRLKVQFQPDSEPGAEIYLNAPSGIPRGNRNNVLGASEGVELEVQVLEYCKAAEELKNAGLKELAREMELKAVDVIRMYLGPTATAGAVEELRGACTSHLNNGGPNPFEHLHRRPIGFGSTNKEATSNGERSTVNVGAGAKTRTCSNCGNEFAFKHWNARYCSDKCRIENWENRTGGKVLKGKP